MKFLLPLLTLLYTPALADVRDPVLGNAPVTSLTMTGILFILAIAFYLVVKYITPLRR